MNRTDRYSKSGLTLPSQSYPSDPCGANVELSTKCKYLPISVNLPLEIQFAIGP